MTYEQTILNRLKGHTGDWNEFVRPEFLQELNDLADYFIEKNTVEGFLAALLIYHQSCEEIVRLLIRDAQFCIQSYRMPHERN